MRPEPRAHDPACGAGRSHVRALPSERSRGLRDRPVRGGGARRGEGRGHRRAARRGGPDGPHDARPAAGCHLPQGCRRGPDDGLGRAHRGGRPSSGPHLGRPLPAGPLAHSQGRGRGGGTGAPAGAGCGDDPPEPPYRLPCRLPAACHLRRADADRRLLRSVGRLGGAVRRTQGRLHAQPHRDRHPHRRRPDADRHQRLDHDERAFGQDGRQGRADGPSLVPRCRGQRHRRSRRLQHRPARHHPAGGRARPRSQGLWPGADDRDPDPGALGLRAQREARPVGRCRLRPGAGPARLRRPRGLYPRSRAGWPMPVAATRRGRASRRCACRATRRWRASARRSRRASCSIRASWTASPRWPSGWASRRRRRCADDERHGAGHARRRAPHPTSRSPA